MQLWFSNLELRKWFLGVLAVVASLLSIFYAAAFWRFPLNQDPHAWGSFGSYFGGVLGPVVAVFTLIIALEVLRLQQDELKKTSEALQLQADTAASNLRAQRFIDLMNIYREMMETSFQEMYSGHGVVGKSALEMWFTKNDQAIAIKNFAIPGQVNGKSIKPAKDKWESYVVSTKIQQYLRVVFRLLKDAEHLLGEDRYLFMRIFRAQLSRTELSILALNLYFGGQGEAMIPLAKDYGLLKHLSHGLLRNEILKEVGPDVFGRKFVAKNLEASADP